MCAEYTMYVMCRHRHRRHQMARMHKWNSERRALFFCTQILRLSFWRRKKKNKISFFIQFGSLFDVIFVFVGNRIRVHLYGADERRSKQSNQSNSEPTTIRAFPTEWHRYGIEYGNQLVKRSSEYNSQFSRFSVVIFAYQQSECASKVQCGIVKYNEHDTTYETIP